MRSTRRSTNRKGFTLIELLIVVVIIGILAAVAIPKFSNTKEKAFVSTMRSDLKNLVSTQESFFADSSKYGGTGTTGVEGAPYSYKPSQGTTINNITGDATGWSARVTNASAKQTCRIFGGTGTAAAQNGAIPGDDAPADGVPVCVAVP